MNNVLRVIVFILITLSIPIVAFADHGHHHHHRHVSKTDTATPPTSTQATSSVPVSGEIRLQAYTTGYGYPDNTPAGADISNGVLHSVAGGTGTYQDPITIAVGHTISGGRDTLDYPEGTRFYIPNLRKYFIVEDTCGDGSTPQNGPCHTGYQGHIWLDIWVGGQSATKSATLNCEDAITDVHAVIENPSDSYVVIAGAITEGGCIQYGEQ